MLFCDVCIVTLRYSKIILQDIVKLKVFRPQGRAATASQRLMGCGVNINISLTCIRFGQDTDFVGVLEELG